MQAIQKKFQRKRNFRKHSTLIKEMEEEDRGQTLESSETRIRVANLMPTTDPPRGNHGMMRARACTQETRNRNVSRRGEPSSSTWVREPCGGKVVLGCADVPPSGRRAYAHVAFEPDRPATKVVRPRAHARQRRCHVSVAHFVC